MDLQKWHKIQRVVFDTGFRSHWTKKPLGDSQNSMELELFAQLADVLFLYVLSILIVSYYLSCLIFVDLRSVNFSSDNRKT